MGLGQEIKIPSSTDIFDSQFYIYLSLYHEFWDVSNSKYLAYK